MKIRSKKEIQERKEKRNKILKILKRVLDFVIYTWALILTITLIVGSCSNKNSGNVKQKLNKGLLPSSFTYSYVSNFYEGEQTTSQNWSKSLVQGLGLTWEMTTDNLGPNQAYDMLGDNYYWFNNGDYIKVTSFNLVCNQIPYDPSSPGNYRFNVPSACYLYLESGYYVTYFTKVQNNMTNWDYDFTDIQLIRTDDNSPSSSYILNNYFTLYDSHLIGDWSFGFNQVISPNVMVGVNSDSVAIPSSSFNVQQPLVSVSLDLPYFTSGKLVFNRITCQFLTSFYEDAYPDANIGYYSYIYDNIDLGMNKFRLQDGWGICVDVIYSNTLSQYSVSVCSREWNVETLLGVDVKFYTRHFKWLEQSYREINFITKPSQNDISKIVSLNNGIDTSIGGSVPSTDGNTATLFDVFSLLSGAFASLLPIFSISIIPGLTIGVLIFLPFVVTIIILVVKAVKK